MAYTFRLETLLRLRHRQMEAVQFELARLFKDYRAAKHIITTLSEARMHASDKMKDRLAGGMAAGQYQLEMDYLGALTNEIERYAKILMGLEQRIQKTKDILAMRHREKRLVERLKEKDFDAYMLQEQRDEQKKADELAAVRYARK